MRAFLCVFASCLLAGAWGCSSSTDAPAPGGASGAAGSGTAGGGAAAGGSGGQLPQAGSSGSTGTAGQAPQGGSIATAGAGGGASGGSAGVGGGSGGSGTGGTGSGSPCGTGSIFCTDFEDAAVPAALLFYPEYQRATQTSIALDTAVFHGGARALKVTGTDFSQMLGVTVPSKFWGRVYLRSDTDIQMGHNTYVAAGTADGDPNNGEYVRIGEHQCQLELNRKSDDKELLSNGGMYMCSGGVKLVKDTWYCLEFLYDGPAKEARVFVDGTEVTALHATDWGPYDYKIFKLGFEKYHGAAKTLWYDDLALASEQVHCL